MKKFLNARMHGFADFAVVALFGLGPTLFGFTGIVSTLCYGLAGVHLTLTLLTNFPFGVVKVVPFNIHGWVELAVAPTLVAIPWVFGFGQETTAMTFFTAFGAVVFGAWMCTDYKNNGMTGSGSGTGSGGNRILRTVPRDEDKRRSA